LHKNSEKRKDIQQKTPTYAGVFKFIENY